MRPYRRLAGVLALLVIALLANLSWVQVIDADAIRQQQGNTRLLLEQYNKARGPILVEAEPVASSARAAGDNVFQRSYTDGPVFAAATGFYSLMYGATGIERAENGVLSGSDPRLFVDRVQQLFAGRRQAGGAVSLTLDAEAQRAAYAALGDHRGAVVALDARTGAILVLVSTPSFDPQVLAPNDPAGVRVAYESLVADPAKPMDNRALDRVYQPGTPFAIITLAAALASGSFEATSLLPAANTYVVPGTNTAVRNHGADACGGKQQVTLLAALATQCETALAWLGNAVGDTALRDVAAQFGFEASLGTPLAARASSIGSTDAGTTAIGGGAVRVSALQLAVLVATVANRGVALRPHLVQDLRGPDLAILDRTRATSIGTPMSTAAAIALARALRASSLQPHCAGCAIPGQTVHTIASTGSTGPAVVVAYSSGVAVASIIESTGAADRDRAMAIEAANAVLRSARRTP